MPRDWQVNSPAWAELSILVSFAWILEDRTLLDFNPWTVSSEPGQDLVAEAMQHVAGEGRSEKVLDGEGTKHVETPDLQDDTVPAFYNDEQSDGRQPEHDADTGLGSDGPSQGTKASLSTSTFANPHSQAPSILMQSSHKCTASTLKQGHLKAFKAEADAHESRMVELASKWQDYKMALLAVKKQKMEIVGTWEHEKECIAAEEHQMAAK